MKIMILASFAPSLANFRGSLIEALVDLGHEVLVVAPDINPTLSKKLNGLGATPHQLTLSRTGLNPLGDIGYCWKLYRLIRQTQPNLLFSYTIKPNIWGAFAAALAHVPSIAMVTGLGAGFTEAGSPPRLKQSFAFAIARRLYRWSTKFNRRVIFQNADDQADFVAAGCLREPQKAVQVDGSGVDTEHFARAAPFTEPVFLMVARLLGNKGIYEYAEAARTLRTRHPNAQFALVGPYDPGVDGIDPQQIETWIADGVIDYRGSAEDVRPHMAKAMVYVLPSYREGTPRSVLEAMAMGRAIITTDAPGCRDTIRNGIDGFLVPPRDGQALAEAMEKFLTDPELNITMGQKAYERALVKYDVKRINRVMIEFLKV